MKLWAELPISFIKIRFSCDQNIGEALAQCKKCLYNVLNTPYFSATWSHPIAGLAIDAFNTAKMTTFQYLKLSWDQIQFFGRPKKYRVWGWAYSLESPKLFLL